MKREMLWFHEKLLRQLKEQKDKVDEQHNNANKGEEKIVTTYEVNMIAKLIMIEERHIFRLKEQIRKDNRLANLRRTRYENQ